MDPERYQRLFEIFERARALAGAAREELLIERCAGDADLRREVDALLASHEDQVNPVRETAAAAGRARLAGLLAETHDEQRLPATIGPYRILRRIGAGGMGIVYEAEQDNPSRRVALKVLHPSHAHGERLRRFRRESELLARLHHPGIAQVFAAETVDQGHGEQPWFAMELVDGLPLVDYAERNRLDRRARLELVALVCDAVQHAHDKGIIHRDLKPDNVLVDADGRPKILDFGVARSSEPVALLSTIQTGQGQLLGTVTHMAPEQLDGDPGAVGPTADVWALGVVLFELLTGRLPYDLAGLSLTAAMRTIGARGPKRMTAFDRSLRGDLDTIAAKALETESGRRYASPAALAADLRRYLGSEPISARPPSATYRARRFVQRHPGPTVGVLVALVAIAASFVAVLEYANSESAARNRAQTAAQDAQDALELAERSRIESQSALFRSMQLTLPDDPWRVHELLAQVPRAERGWEWRWLMRQAPFVPEFPWQRDKTGILDFAAFIDERTLVPSRGFDHRDEIVRCVDLARPTEFVPGGVAAATQGAVLADPFGWDTVSEDDPSVWHCVVYDASSGAVAREFPQFSGTVLIVDSVEDGPLLVRDNATQTVTVHPPDGGPPLFAVERSEYFSSQYEALSSDGRLLFVTVDATHFKALDTATGALVWETSLIWWPKRVRYDPFGERIGVVEDTRVRILDARSGEQLLEFEGPRGAAQRDEPHIAFARDASVLAIQRSSGKTVIFDADTGEALHEFGPRRTELGFWPRIALSPSGRRVAMAALNSRSPWVVDLEDESDPAFTVFEGSDDFVYWLTLSLDGGILAAATFRGDKIAVWDAWSGELLVNLPRGTGTEAGPTGLQSFSHDGRHLVYTTNTEEHGPHIVRLDLLTGAVERGEGAPWTERHNVPSTYSREMVRLTGRDAPDFNGRIAPHPEGGRLFMSLPVYFNPNGMLPMTDEWEIEEFSRWSVEGIEVSPDGEFLALGMKEDMPHSVVVVRTDDGSRVAEIEAIPGGETLGVAWSPDGGRLAIGMRTGEIRLYETRYWTCTMTLPSHDEYVLDLCWSPDGEMLYSGSGDRTVRLWDTQPPLVRRLRIEDRAAATSEAAERLAALTAELGSHAAAADRMWAEATDEEARIAVRRACIAAWAD